MHLVADHKPAFPFATALRLTLSRVPNTTLAGPIGPPVVPELSLLPVVHEPITPAVAEADR